MPEVVVTGHTDTTGTPPEQLRARAEARDDGAHAPRRGRPRPGVDRSRRRTARPSCSSRPPTTPTNRAIAASKSRSDDVRARPSRGAVRARAHARRGAALALSARRSCATGNTAPTTRSCAPRRPGRPSGRIVIVDIDDRSLTTVGQWPWRRDVVGQLVSRLRDLGAATVALDIIFAEPDRFEGHGPPPDEIAGRHAARRPRRARLRDDVRSPAQRADSVRRCTRSASPSCGATIPPRSRSSTRRARSATCRC